MKSSTFGINRPVASTESSGANTPNVGEYLRKVVILETISRGTPEKSHILAINVI